MWLDLADLLGCESAQTRDPVRLRAPLELVECRHLARIGGHDQLPALVVRNLLLLAVLPQTKPAGGAELRLERAGRVVDARVHDTAVAAGLVQRDRRLLLDDDDAPLRESPPELDGGGQPEDPRPDDNDVRPGGQRGFAPGKVALGFSNQGRLSGLDFQDLVLEGFALGRSDLDGLALLLAEDRLADR